MSYGKKKKFFIEQKQNQKDEAKAVKDGEASGEFLSGDMEQVDKKQQLENGNNYDEL